MLLKTCKEVDGLDKITFEISDYSLKEISDSQIMELEMKVVSEGNNRHNLPITRDAVINSAETIIGKPVLFKFDKATEDVMGHEIDEIACGVCSLSKNDYYFKEIDGKLWLIVKAYLWKMYFEDVINVFNRDKEKAISMEMLVVDVEDDEDDATLERITKFCFAGVTILGNIYSPAIENANAVVTKYGDIKTFDKMVEDTKKLLFQKKDTTIKPKKEVENLDKFNKKEFLAKYSLTANEMFEKFESSLSSITYTDNEYVTEKYWVKDYNASYVFCRDWEEKCTKAIPYTYSDKKITCKVDEAKYARMTYVVDEETEEENEDEDMVQVYAEKLVDKKVTEVTKEHETKVTEFEAKVAEFETKVTELETKVTDLETEKTEFETKVTEFETKVTDLEAEKTELSEFKANIVEQDKTNKVNYAIETVKDSLNDEQITEWKAKVDEFENIEAFTNAIQAFAFTQVKQITTDEIQRIHIPQTNKDQEKKGLWD